MSVTPGPTSLATSSIISSTISSIISPTPTSIFISNTTSSFISSTPTSMSYISSSASATPSTTKPGGFGFTDETTIKLAADARNTSDISSQFLICIIVGILCFLAFCIFRTRHVLIKYIKKPNMLMQFFFFDTEYQFYFRLV